MMKVNRMIWTKPKMLLLGVGCLAYVYCAIRFNLLGLYGSYVVGKALALGLLLVIAVIAGIIRHK
jgi:hypothetical protein